MVDTEIQVQLVSEVPGDVDRVARARKLTAVVITKSGPVQLMPLVRLVSALRDMPLSVTARRIESSSGIILRDATPQEAEALSQELLRQDVPLALIPTGKLPEVRETAQLFRVRVGSRGLRLRLDDGRSVDVKWKDVLTVTCVRLEGHIDGETLAPARLVLSVFTREPFACYQLSENIPPSAPRPAKVPYEPKVRFERLGRAIYETFTRSSQNKGMRILSTYGLRGRWKDLTFNKTEQIHKYNYWLALLRKHQTSTRRVSKPKFSIPWLRRIEFEPEARTLSSLSFTGPRTRHLPAPAPQKSPITVAAQEWMPNVTWQQTPQGTWLNYATLLAAICLAVYIILELLG